MAQAATKQKRGKYQDVYRIAYEKCDREPLHGIENMGAFIPSTRMKVVSRPYKDTGTTERAVVMILNDMNTVPGSVEIIEE